MNCTAWTYWKPFEEEEEEEDADVHTVRVFALADLVHWGYRALGVPAVD
jgi:hypothetical protein